LKIDVHLHGILRDHLPREARGRTKVQMQHGATVGHLVDQLGIERRVVTAVNNEEKDRAHILEDGDRVSIFTVIGGGADKSNLEEGQPHATRI
jgi:thiamine biosynthesis protein ThiS